MWQRQTIILRCVFQRDRECSLKSSHTTHCKTDYIIELFTRLHISNLSQKRFNEPLILTSFPNLFYVRLSRSFLLFFSKQQLLQTLLFLQNEQVIFIACRLGIPGFYTLPSLKPEHFKAQAIHSLFTQKQADINVSAF